ncbi:DNA lyase [Candidatus Pacearchaeota archaeon CG10_big_fil_rev_8_21_14_0_10_31_24]|nr:MAG: DNA lyase [Candidatus Pacearchaeota archaeon CG10_big_fil_rev_8_21_14_0_10_31_24]
MKKQEVLSKYEIKKKAIEKHLNNFQNLSKEREFKEFIFCMLTPQSNAKKCWEAIEQISNLNKLNNLNIVNILKTKTRFHNNKTISILKAKDTWNQIYSNLKNQNKLETRNNLAKQVRGYGLKEASHFLRNIGQSNNEIAILDRHIIRNLAEIGIIKKEDSKIKNQKHYLELEQKFLKFSKEINIPIDHLDLLFWSQETGELFK